MFVRVGKFNQLADPVRIQTDGGACRATGSRWWRLARLQTSGRVTKTAETDKMALRSVADIRAA